jgi:exodeoxyribonuclease VII large subunit
MFNQDEIYTVSDFLHLCKNSIERDIPHCWIQGEISNLSRPSSGHLYFSLKDSTGQIRCAFFRLSQRNIRFTLENGMSIVMRGAPTVYELRGDFQMVVQQIEPVGVGNLQLAFDQLKNKLLNEGIFDDSNKKKLPLSPKTIGVISSSSGAVIRDIFHVLKQRYPYADILLYDTVVQGENAHKKIINALISADSSKLCDVLILARGGGSLEDLWSFNEEELGRAIFSCHTPIISAIGHETDTTIADFVADVRAPTPTAAAVIATPDRLTLIDLSRKLRNRLHDLIRQAIEGNKQTLKQLQFRISNPKDQLQKNAQKLDDYELRLNYFIRHRFILLNSKLRELKTELNQHSPYRLIDFKLEQSKTSKERLLKNITGICQIYRSKLEQLNNRLHLNTRYSIKNESKQLIHQANRLHILSPLSTLSRGYSITHNEKGDVILSSKVVELGDIVNTKLKQGQFTSKVIKKSDT